MLATTWETAVDTALSIAAMHTTGEELPGDAADVMAGMSDVRGRLSMCEAHFEGRPGDPDPGVRPGSVGGRLAGCLERGLLAMHTSDPPPAEWHALVSALFRLRDALLAYWSDPPDSQQPEFPALHLYRHEPGLDHGPALKPNGP